MRSGWKKVGAFFLVAALSLSMGSAKVSAAENTVNVKLDVQYGQVEARTITDMVNEFRTGSEAWYWNEDNTTKTVCNNLGTLTYDKTLEQAAMKRAAELALGYSHTRVNGESCFTAFSEYGYTGRASGENIAAGYASAQSVFVGWREDEDDYDGQGHRRNMLNSNFDAIGMGHVYSNGVHYWAMELGNVNSAGDSGVDGNQTVTIEILDSSIQSLSTAQESYQTVSGNSIDLPTVNAVAAAPSFWPAGGSAAVTVVNPAWSVGDAAIASVADGKIVGHFAGSTTLTASVGSATVTVTINVVDNGSGGDTPGDGGNEGNTPGDGGNEGNTPGDGGNEGNTPGDGGNEGNPPGGGGNEGNTPGDGGNEGNNPRNGGDEGSNSGNGGSSNGGSGGSGESSGKSAEKEVIIVPVTSVVGGVKSATNGAYMATNVNGTIVTTSESAIAQNYSLANNEKPYAKFSNFDAKKSPLAKKTIDSAAAAQGAAVGPILNIELGKMTAGKYSLLPSDGSAIRLVIGIPKSFMQADKTYAVVCVREGGAYTVLKDLDKASDTVTFETTGGAGVYAIIKY